MKNFFLKPESRKKLAQKILVKTMKRWGIYSPKRKLAVRLNCQSDSLPVDWPVDRQRSKIRPLEQPGRPPGRPPRYRERALWSGRPPGRPPRYREQGSLVRSTGPVSARRAQGCARRSTATAALGSVDRAVDRPGLSATIWVRTWVKIILINLVKIYRNPQK